MKRSQNQDPVQIEQAVIEAVAATWGHFRYESGHHGDLWLDLEGLFVDARRMRDWAAVLARRAAVYRPALVCGPLTGGAFLAQAVAAELGADFIFAERLESAGGVIRYLIPESLQQSLPGRRVLLVDDAINAGSALRATLVELLAGGSELAGLASLLSLGQAAAEIAEQQRVPLFTLAALENGLWSPEECPLCASGLPLVKRVATQIGVIMG